MAHLRRDARRVVQIHDRLALVAKKHPLVHGGQEAAREHGVAAAGRAARGQYDIPGKILRCAAERIGDP
jgi:hypothetical protein